MKHAVVKQTTEDKKLSLATGVTLIIMLLLFVLYAGLRWTNESLAFEKAKQTADTPAYLRISGESFLSKAIWAKARPPMFPLILKIFDADVIKVSAFQAAFSIFSWGALAFSLAYTFKGILRPIAFALILALSLERHIAGWDVVLLTESISISLMALFIATWLWLLKRWSWGKMGLLSLVAFLWAFTRDTNSWILLMIAGLILLSVLFWSARKRYLAIAFMFILIFLFSNFSAEAGKRWVFPFQNVLAQRILPDNQAMNFFANCGMPVTPELLDLADGFANSNDRAFYTDQALEPYRVWLFVGGKSCYMRWLLSRPLASLRAPWDDVPWLLAFSEVTRFYPQAYEPILPWYMEKILYPRKAHWLLLGLVTIAALVAIWKKLWKTNPAWVVFIGLCLLIYPHVFIVWHADVLGTDRHALTISIQFVISLWLLGLFILEAIFARLRVRGFSNILYL